MPRETRLLSGEVVRCGSCPFHYSQVLDADMPDGDTFKAGFYCLHAQGRHRSTPFVTLDDFEKTRAATLHDYLFEATGSHFPACCPLVKKPDGVPQPKTHRRELDLT